MPGFFTLNRSTLQKNSRPTEAGGRSIGDRRGIPSEDDQILRGMHPCGQAVGADRCDWDGRSNGCWLSGLRSHCTGTSIPVIWSGPIETTAGSKGRISTGGWTFSKPRLTRRRQRWMRPTISCRVPRLSQENWRGCYSNVRVNPKPTLARNRPISGTTKRFRAHSKAGCRFVRPKVRVRHRDGLG